MKKYLFILPIIGMVATLAIAQTQPTATPMLDNILSDVQHYGLFFMALWEVVVRFFPTVSSWSIMANLMRLLEFFFPDKNTEGGVHSALIRSISIQDIKIGDNVRTTEGSIHQVIDKYDETIVVQTPVGNTQNLSIEQILEVVKKGYVLVDTLKYFIGLIKQLFGKKI